MSRAILIAWLPWFLCLVAACAALGLVLGFSGARLQLAKVRRLHRCEEGSVQTLSFVFTLPLFILLLMFIVQVADMMMAIGIIHYAAFAAARAASVWIPAEMGYQNEPANTFDGYSIDTRQACDPEWHSQDRGLSGPQNQLWKFRKIWNAAAIACAPMAPSRDLTIPSQTSSIATTIEGIYPTLVTASAQYPRIRQLIEKKLAYSARNTWVVFSGADRDMAQGPTYNPCPGHYEGQDQTTGEPIWIPWNPQEVGWEDAITVSVYHNYALLPGPGRFLATALSSPDGAPDRVSPIVRTSSKESYKADNDEYRLYLVVLSAAVTLSNEGLKSVMPYVQPND